MFKYISESGRRILERRAIEQIAANAGSVETAAAVAFVTLAEQGAIDGVTASEHMDMFLPWASKTDYTAGDLRSYNEVLYKCVQPHTSQSDWTPDIAVSLWVKAGDPREEYPMWSQPVGAHDAYNKGDKVTFGEKKWQSDVDSNVWQPGVYGWSEVNGI